METKETSLLSPARRRALMLFMIAPPLLLGLTSNETLSLSNTAFKQAGRLRLAMLSYWHVHAPEYARQALSHSSTDLVAVWDEDLERGRTQARALGVSFYERLEDLLRRPDIDGVIVDTPTTMHRDVIVAALQAGKHIFTEKVLAPTLRECNEIVAALNRSNLVLMVSLPRLYTSATLAIKEILGRHLLGDLTEVRVRLFHDGALRTLIHPQGWLPPFFYISQQTGGGAMIDLGAHPMYLVREFLGLPESVSATYGYVTGRAVEDNAFAFLRYQRGVVGVVETGFVNLLAPFTIEVHGTDGSLLYGTPEGKILIHSTHLKNAGSGWQEWAPLPPDQPTPFEQWIAHIQQGTRAHENAQAAIELSMLMEAANSSAQRDLPVRLETLPR